MGTVETVELVASFAGERALLDRGGAAERVADALRTRITAGFFPPGTRLSEESLSMALGVSRNTLREAFQLLCHERLAIHQLNRGVFVRTLTSADVADLYQLRRVVEGAAVRGVRRAPPGALAEVGEAVAHGQRAAAADDWREVGTADLRFHQALAGLAGSGRIDELMRRTLAELRLGFHAVRTPRELHEPYLERNAQIHLRCAAGDGSGAARILDGYLRDSERQLLCAFDRPAASATSDWPQLRRLR